MSKYFLRNAVIGLDAAKSPAGDIEAGAAEAAFGLYIAYDTGAIYVSTDEGWTLFGTIVMGSYVGVTTDNAGGLTLTAIAAVNEILSGPGGTTPTHVSTQKSGQTGPLYKGVGSDGATKFSVGVDGEVLSADDVIAIGGVKASESVTAWGVSIQGSQPVLATGAAHSVDDVITFLQSLGFCKQS